MTTSLLIAEHPLVVLPGLACRIGLNEAMLLQQVHFLSLRSSNGWVAKPLGDWCDVFPFLSRRSIERAFGNLRTRGLLTQELVPGGGRRTRVRVDHDAVDAFTETYETRGENGEENRQFGGTNPPNWRDQSANLAGPIRQIGGTRASECRTTEGTAEGSFAPSRERPTEDLVSLVFTTWQTSTGRTDAVLDDKRRRLIAKALKLKPLDDLLDAVKGWRHSAHHHEATPPLNDIEMLLNGAGPIERFCNLERHRGDSSKLPGGKLAAACPGPADDDVILRWMPIAGRLVELVPAEQRDIWLGTLHPHADVDGTLLLGIAPEVASWVADRWRKVLDQAADGTPVTLIECAGIAA